MTFKPKKAQIHVPGYGLVTKEEFNKDHTAALFARADRAGIKRDAFIEQHLRVDSYGDMPLFENVKEPVPAEELPREPEKKTRTRKKKGEEETQEGE